MRHCITFFLTIAIVCSIASITYGYAVGDELSEQEKAGNLLWKYIHQLEDEKNTVMGKWQPEELVDVSIKEEELNANVFDVQFVPVHEGDMELGEICSIASAAVSDAFKMDEKQLTLFHTVHMQWKGERECYWFISFAEGGYCLLTGEGEVTERLDYDLLTPKDQMIRHGTELTVELTQLQYGRDREHMWPVDVLCKAMLGYGDPAEGIMNSESVRQIALEEVKRLRNAPIPEDLHIHLVFYKGGPWKVMLYRTINVLYAEVYVDDKTQDVIQVYFADEANG